MSSEVDRFQPGQSQKNQPNLLTIPRKKIGPYSNLVIRYTFNIDRVTEGTPLKSRKLNSKSSGEIFRVKSQANI